MWGPGPEPHSRWMGGMAASGGMVSGRMDYGCGGGQCGYSMGMADGGMGMYGVGPGRSQWGGCWPTGGCGMGMGRSSMGCGGMCGWESGSMDGMGWDPGMRPWMPTGRSVPGLHGGCTVGMNSWDPPPRSGPGPHADSGGNNSLVYHGTIKSFNDEKGWGHIACESTRQRFGRDMFVMRSAFRGCRVQVGDRVAFTFTMGVKGPQAEEVRLLESKAGTGFTSQDAVGRAFVGKLKQYSEDKGWGFIECKETHHMFGKDIFVHKREFDPGIILDNGDSVMFLVVSGKDGRPEAKDVTPHSDASTDGSSAGMTGAACVAGAASTSCQNQSKEACAANDRTQGDGSTTQGLVPDDGRSAVEDLSQPQTSGACRHDPEFVGNPGARSMPY